MMAGSFHANGRYFFSRASGIALLFGPTAECAPQLPIGPPESVCLLVQIRVGHYRERIEAVGFATFHAATSSPQRNSSAPPSAVIARRIE